MGGKYFPLLRMVGTPIDFLRKQTLIKLQLTYDE
jgi:hypothetical protein